MVLVSNPNIILSTFKRDGSSQEVKKIIVNFQKIKKQYEEAQAPEKPCEPDNTYTDSVNQLFHTPSNTKSSTEQTYEANKRAYNTAVYDLDTKYGHR